MIQLTTRQAAEILAVSGATVRNWARAGHLPVASSNPLSFGEADVLQLKERIRTNRFNRLRKRANKTASEKIPKPADTDAAVPGLARLVEELSGKGVKTTHALFTAAIVHLESLGELILPAHGLSDFSGIRWKRQAFRKVMERWRRRAGRFDNQLSRDDFAPFLSWEVEDKLGLLYQSLCSVGKKARAGAYFTPSWVIDESLEDFPETPRSFLDPCCGTGRYLMRAAQRWGIAPARLFGFDTDPLAVDIARINILLAYPELDAMPAVHCLDSLQDLANGNPDCKTNHLLGSVDAIATNPPWGGCKNRVRYKNLLSLIKSGESFSLFLEKSLQLVRPGGRLSFILPESMLKTKAHADLRRLLLEQSHIQKICMLGRIFTGVFTPIIRLDLVKTKPAVESSVLIQLPTKKYHAAQSRFTNNPNQAFDITVGPRDEEIIRKIYRVNHATLKGNADWALGIVTGDNRRILLKKPQEHTEPILRGRDILKFAYREPQCHVVYEPGRFQQTAPERLYRAREKLVYRFVSDQLIFAYDDKGMLTLNSANIVIPRLAGISIKTALALFNSKVFEYLFRKCCSTRKVLRSDLETLPFPFPTNRQTKLIEAQVQACMSGDYQPAEVLDEMVFRLFGLNGEDVAVIEAELEACQP